MADRVALLLDELERLRPLVVVHPKPAHLPEPVLRDAIALSRAVDRAYPQATPSDQRRLRVVAEFMRDNALPFGAKLLRRS